MTNAAYPSFSFNWPIKTINVPKSNYTEAAPAFQPALDLIAI